MYIINSYSEDGFFFFQLLGLCSTTALFSLDSCYLPHHPHQLLNQQRHITSYNLFLSASSALLSCLGHITAAAFDSEHFTRPWLPSISAIPPYSFSREDIGKCRLLNNKASHQCPLYFKRPLEFGQYFLYFITWILVSCEFLKLMIKSINLHKNIDLECSKNHSFYPLNCCFRTFV